MTRRERLDYFRLVASFALVGAVMAGTFMWIMPRQPAFDLRYLGAVVGGAIAAIKLLRRA